MEWLDKEYVLPTYVSDAILLAFEIKSMKNYDASNLWIKYSKMFEAKT